MNKGIGQVKAAVLAALAAVMLGGCATAPWAEEPGDICDFEFPFVNDYDIVNKTTFRWDDSFVTNNPAEYRQEIAGPLSALAASAYGFRLFTDIRSLMSMGFPPERVVRCYGDDLRYDTPKYGRDRVGYTIASRQCEIPGEDFQIVMVVVRGTFGRDEWISNVNIANAWGEKENPDPAEMPHYHEGFSKAADSVLEALAAYVASNRIDLSVAKILVTGHSRGAAVANLIGARLDDGTAGGVFAAVKAGNVFAYTFAAPGVSIRPTEGMKDPKYGNIFNVINPEDIVPCVPLASWGAQRFGHDLYLRSCNFLPFTGTWSNPGYVGMKNAHREISGYDYYHLLGGAHTKESLGRFVEGVIPTVRKYYRVPPELRAEGKFVCPHSVLEMILCNNMASARDKAQQVSLMSDMAHISSAYTEITNQKKDGIGEEMRKLDHRLRFVRRRNEDGLFNPDGRDFSRQPGVWDILWQLTCTHSFSTYVAWMKSAEAHGPDSVFYNWDDEDDIPHNEWLIDYIF